MDNTSNKALIINPENAMATAGEIANFHAARSVFADYLSRKADNTLHRHANDLARFAKYLSEAGIIAGDLQFEPDAWDGITWGIVEGFRNWMLGQGDSVGSINTRLSAVKVYAGLAAKVGTISSEEYGLIRLVKGYGRKEGRHIDARRLTTRRSTKKESAVPISLKQAKLLKTQLDTPQGRRDALLMCLLLDHGLRVGEVARLQVSDFDLKAGLLHFYRPKVDKEQTHKLTADTIRAIRAWYDAGDAPAIGPVLRGSRKGGALTNVGMSERSITARVRALGELIGLVGLSAHDCRHHWATYWAAKIDPFRLKEAGGWNSMTTVDRYIEAGKIANEGMA